MRREEDGTIGIERRNLLKGLGLGAAGAAAVAAGVLPGGAAGAAETPQEQVKGRYQDNEHVRRFYALNRL